MHLVVKSSYFIKADSDNISYILNGCCNKKQLSDAYVLNSTLFYQYGYKIILFQLQLLVSVIKWLEYSWWKRQIFCNYGI